MFNKLKADVKSLSKRINRQLVGNFFTIEEFKELSNRHAYKVIKTISKIENVKLSKSEIKSIVRFIRTDFENIEEVNTAVKLWDFVVSLVEEKNVEIIEDISTENKYTPQTYRFGRFDLLRM